MDVITNDHRDRICAVIDSVKMDDRQLDTNEYAGAIEQIMTEVVGRAVLASRQAVDPLVLAQQILDRHAIRPDWRRSGEQILNLIAEGIAEATGQPGPPQNPLGGFITSTDRLKERIVEVLPWDTDDNHMPFVEVAQRVRDLEVDAGVVRAALVVLMDDGQVLLKYGFGWSKVAR